MGWNSILFSFSIFCLFIACASIGSYYFNNGYDYYNQSVFFNDSYEFMNDSYPVIFKDVGNAVFRIGEYGYDFGYKYPVEDDYANIINNLPLIAKGLGVIIVFSIIGFKSILYVFGLIYYLIKFLIKKIKRCKRSEECFF